MAVRFRCSNDMNKKVKELFEKSREDKFWSWTSETETAEFIASVIKLIGAKTVLEIGVFKGFTSYHMMDALPKDGKYFGVDIEDLRDKELFELIGKEGFDYSFILGNSHDVIPTLQKHTFDFIFIDGNHTYDHVVREFKECEKIIKKGGIIAVHDTILIPQVTKFIEWVQSHKHFEVITLPTPDVEGRGGASGISLIRCKYGK